VGYPEIDEPLAETLGAVIAVTHPDLVPAEPEPTGPVSLSAADAAQIRASFVAAVKTHGGTLEDGGPVEFGVPAHMRAFERRMREAIRLFDRARAAETAVAA
jgi:hypothetical protein